MKSTLPTLTLDGYLTNKHLLISKLWIYYLASNKSQSNTFSIHSLKYDLNTSRVDRSLASGIESSLVSLFGSYFDKVAADIDVKTDKTTNTQFCKIALTLTDEDKKYYLYKELESKNGEITNYLTQLDELYEEYNNFNN